MKTYSKIVFLALAIVFAGVMASTANTLNMVVTGTADTAGFDFNFAKFNPSLGTLTGITLNITGFETGSFTIKNNLGTSDTVNTPKDNFVTLTYLAEGNAMSYLAVFKPLDTGDTFPYPINGGQQLTFDLTAENNLSPYSDVMNSSRFSSYIGTGDAKFFNISNAPQATTAGGHYTANTSGIKTVATVQVVYSYTAVPEPSTWACLIIGMVVVAHCSRGKLFARQS